MWRSAPPSKTKPPTLSRRSTCWNRILWPLIKPEPERTPMKLSSHVAPVAALLVALSLPAALGAATISGTAIDKTTNKPAAGDTAVLLDLQQGMTESGR